MQRRTILILASVFAVAALLACAVGGVGGYYAFQAIRSEQQQMEALFATTDALEPPVGPLDPTSDPEDDTFTPDADATAEPTDTDDATPVPLAELDLPAVALPTGPLPDWSAALAPQARAALAQYPQVPVYQINAQFYPEQRVISGAEVVQITNTENVPLNEIYFRLYANAPFYQDGGISVADVQVNNAAAQTALEVNDTALKVALPQPLAPGQQATVSMRFVARVPTAGGYGILGESDGVFSLYGWHPELDVYENNGWLLNPATEQGDPTNTDAANYSVQFAAPQGYDVVSSGVEAEPTTADGQDSYQITAALTRNFVIVASDQFTSKSQTVGDVTVNAYFRPGDEGGGNVALETAARSIDVFGAQFGPYVYPELDVVETALGGGAAGMESTGMIMLGRDYYGAEQSGPLQGLGTLVPGADKISVLGFIAAHETAHQWWYGVVGSDAYAHPWLDESLTNWASAFFYDKTVGEGAGLLARDLFIRSEYQQAVAAQADVKLDQPVDRFSESDYSTIVYGKGALMYDALHQQIGDEKFFAFLRQYYAAHQFQRVDGAEWQRTLAQVIGQEAAASFYQKWVEGTGITPADLPPAGPLGSVLNGAPEPTATP